MSTSIIDSKQSNGSLCIFFWGMAFLFLVTTSIDASVMKEASMDGLPVKAPIQIFVGNTVNDAQQGPESEQGKKVLIFNTVEFKRPLSSLPAWNQLLERNKQSPIFIAGKQFSNSSTWDSFKSGAQGKTGLALLRYVHTFWNKWPYREDIVNWGVQDYWASPQEFLKKSGDCEDFAIAKYFTLKALGFPPDKMRIVVLRDTVRNLAHAVLVVYLNDDAYVLDNLSSAVLSHTRFKHYTPQYSVNELGRWAHLKGRPAQTR